MTNVLIDTNVILDVLLRRAFFYDDSAQVLGKIDNRRIKGNITASAVTDIFYILNKSKTDAVDVLKKLLMVVDVLNVYKETIIRALYSGWGDFEDAVQIQAAVENSIDFIVTRNVKDFRQSSAIKAVTPAEFIRIVSPSGDTYR